MVLSRPWATSAEFMAGDDLSWYQLLTMRAMAQKHNYDMYRWIDFRVEKDRCAMADFIDGNGFPSCTVAAKYGAYDHARMAMELPELLATVRWPRPPCRTNASEPRPQRPPHAVTSSGERRWLRPRDLAFTRSRARASRGVADGGVAADLQDLPHHDGQLQGRV